MTNNRGAARGGRNIASPTTNRARYRGSVDSLSYSLAKLPRRCSPELNKKPGVIGSLAHNLFFGKRSRAFINCNGQIIRQSPSFNFRVVSHNFLVVLARGLWSGCLIRCASRHHQRSQHRLDNFAALIGSNIAHLDNSVVWF